MTLDEALELAKLHVNATGGCALGRYLVDTLGESQPCGFEPPCTDQPGIVAIMCGDEPCYEFTPAEARWFAGALLRAAEAAEKEQP